MFQPKLLAFFALIFCLFALAGCSSAPVRQDSRAVPSPQSETRIPPGRFLFTAQGCIHCATVAQYVQEHDIRRQMYYIEQTVGTNGNGDQILAAVAARCRIPAAELSVPLFWDGTACHVGSDAVIAYFESNTKP